MHLLPHYSFQWHVPPDPLVSLEPGSLFHLHYAQLWSSLAFSGLFHLSPQLILHHFVSCSLTFASDDNMI
jgi:hypothetical protein